MPGRIIGDITRDRVAQTIKDYYAAHGRPPTYREVMELSGLLSTGHVSIIVEQLEAAGRIRIAGGSRGLFPCEQP